MLEKIISLDRIEVFKNNAVQIYFYVSIFENQQLISNLLNYKTIVPGEDYSAEDAKVQAVCAAVHTPEAVAAYQASRAEPVNEAV